MEPTSLLHENAGVCLEMLRQRRGEKVERGAEVDRFKIEVILGFTLGLLMHRKQHFVFLSY